MSDATAENRVLVLGSTVCDVVIDIDEFPTHGGDVTVTNEQLQLGGCAYNVSDMLRHFGTAHTLCSPVGNGRYGAFVAQEFSQRGIPIFARIDEDNGCCYCIVDKAGERTFLSRHGAEYLFNRAWFSDIADGSYDALYVCGLELEERTSNALVSFIEEKKRRATQEQRTLDVFFAPSPRVCEIQARSDYLERLFALGAFLHLNRDEALRCTRAPTVETAARALTAKTHNSLVVTLGADGAYFLDARSGESGTVAAFPVPCVADTIGAGDAHCGAVIAGVHCGLSLRSAVERANAIAAAVVGVRGATLTDAEFAALGLCRHGSAQRQKM